LTASGCVQPQGICFDTSAHAYQHGAAANRKKSADSLTLSGRDNDRANAL